jgi:hypothetical protein
VIDPGELGDHCLRSVEPRSHFRFGPVERGREWPLGWMKLLHVDDQMLGAWELERGPSPVFHSHRSRRVHRSIPMRSMASMAAGEPGIVRPGTCSGAARRPGRARAARARPGSWRGRRFRLLGRRSYEWLAARWPSRRGELADRLNSLPKYVVSSTLEHPDWNNSRVLKGDVVDEASNLRQELNQ